MQTFLPYRDFQKSVSCLDYRRLGKQRVEARQILDTCYSLKMNPTISRAWVNHPAVLMWKNYEDALRLYYNCAIKEWVARGYKNNMTLLPEAKQIIFPSWLGNEDFHASHRSNLLRKDSGYYCKFGWKESDNMPYFWPERIIK